MKCVLIVLAALVASACASYGGYHHHYVPGFAHVPHGIVSAYRNDLRQLHVNRVANHIGAGIGTGRFVGVPGTGGHFGYAYHGYGGRGYGGYGYGHH